MQKFSLKLPLALAVVGTAAVFSLNGSWPWLRLSDVSTTAPILVTSAYNVISDTLHNGESVSNLLDRQGVTGLNLTSLAIALSFDPKRIKAGLVFSVHRDGLTNQATHVEFRPTPEQRVQFIRTSGGWTGQAVPVRWTTDTIRVAGSINSSLYQSFDTQISEATLNTAERARAVDELTRVNGWSIDFANDIKRGDRFAAVLERSVSEDGDIRFGRILASQILVNGTDLKSAFRYDVVGGKVGYYDMDGKTLQRAFLKSPVEYRYISSNFSSARFHPILGLMRRHEGTDYAAARGTPVQAAGDGTVISAGWSGGYGNLVEIRHANGITTRYGHLWSVAVRAGTRVSQGDLIGRVGSTGLATGPHLHYEFRVNGVARNPANAEMGSGAPLPNTQLADFSGQRDQLLQLLGSSLKSRTIALAE